MGISHYLTIYMAENDKNDKYEFFFFVIIKHYIYICVVSVPMLGKIIIKWV